MEPSSQIGTLPVTAPGDFTVLDIVEEQFENLLDVPFITVNMIDGKIAAEIVKSQHLAETNERIQQALDVGTLYGQHAWARVHGGFHDEDYEVVTIHFMPDRHK